MGSPTHRWVLAAWLTEKLRAWSDSKGDVESRFTKDQILTLVSIYWFTKMIGTSVRHYRSIRLSSGGIGVVPAQVPQGYAEFVLDPWRGNMPRSYVAEPAENVTRWSRFRRSLSGHRGARPDGAGAARVLSSSPLVSTSATPRGRVERPTAWDVPATTRRPVA